ncbi:MAG: FAD-dependent oxidoreductase [Lautropia sp.]|nr:FAD-dependent oxidoreductase [Lautropia sp.]
MNTCDVAVVGAGSVGAAAALAFARAGKHVALIDPRPHPFPRQTGRSGFSLPGSAVTSGGLSPLPSSVLPADPDDWDVRVFALSPASCRLLGELGVWHRMALERIAPVHDMRLFHDADGGARQASLQLEAYQGQVALLAHIVEGRHLQGALDAAVADAAKAFRLTRLETSVAALSLPEERDLRHGAELRLANGESWRAGLVVAADGARSPLREMAGLGHQVLDYHQTALVTNFNSALPTRDAAWQWFDRDQGVMALLPLPANGRPGGTGRVSLVWSAPTARAEALRAMPPEGLAIEVAALSRGALGALQPISSVASFPLRAIRCERVIAPAFVMIGDAAHAIHPMAGQGMNLGMGDVQALIDALLTGHQGQGWHQGSPSRLLLRRYERARKEPVELMQATMTGLHRLFGPNLPAPFVMARNIGWQLVSASGWLKRQLIAHAIR